MSHPGFDMAHGILDAFAAQYFQVSDLPWATLVLHRMLISLEICPCLDTNDRPLLLALATLCRGLRMPGLKKPLRMSLRDCDDSLKRYVWLSETDSHKRDAYIAWFETRSWNEYTQTEPDVIHDLTSFMGAGGLLDNS